MAKISAHGSVAIATWAGKTGRLVLCSDGRVLSRHTTGSYHVLARLPESAQGQWYSQVERFAARLGYDRVE
jgi:hypothetical protein